MAIGDYATAMRVCAVAMGVDEAAVVGIGVAFTQPRVPFASECRPVALTPLPDRISMKSHRCCVGALHFSSGGDSLLAPYDLALERHDGRSAQHDGLCHRVASPHRVRRSAGPSRRTTLTASAIRCAARPMRSSWRTIVETSACFAQWSCTIARARSRVI